MNIFETQRMFLFESHIPVVTAYLAIPSPPKCFLYSAFSPKLGASSHYQSIQTAYVI